MPSCTSRELNAVDSENKKNHQTDLWRIFQLVKHLSKPGHVWSKFGTGNRDSLSRAARELKIQRKLETATPSGGSGLVTPGPASRIPSPAPSEADADGGVVGREIRHRLIEWWTEEYCASRMNLCLLGKGMLIILEFNYLYLVLVNQNHWMNFQIWPQNYSLLYQIAERTLYP
jgi:insulysin